jgi:hypothetical protein
MPDYVNDGECFANDLTRHRTRSRGSGGLDMVALLSATRLSQLL